jgi:hypothetical protein
MLSTYYNAATLALRYEGFETTQTSAYLTAINNCNFLIKRPTSEADCLNKIVDYPSRITLQDSQHFSDAIPKNLYR